MKAGSSQRVVFMATGANVVIAIAKFLVAFWTGSSAMLSEAIHSLVDTGNELLLLLGLRESRKPADETHPFGYGPSLYFWGLIVGILIFGFGGGMAIYEGIARIRAPRPLEDPTWNYIVLGVAFVCEGASWRYSLKAMLAARSPGESLWHLIHTSKDPATYTALFEDSAALLGLLIAFLGILLGHLLHNRYLDGVASIGIGVLLGVTGILLVRESRGLLVGESADRTVISDIRALVAQDTVVEHINRVLTLQLGAHDVLLIMAIIFQRGIPSYELAAKIDRIEAAIRQRHPNIKQVFIEAEGVTRAIAEQATPSPSPPGAH